MRETMAVSKCQEVFVDNMGNYLRVHNFSTTHVVLYCISLDTLKMVIILLSQCITLQMKYCSFFSLCNFSQHLKVLFVEIYYLLITTTPAIYMNIKF